MSIVLPSSAARNAAASVQLRIAPPDNLKRCASSAKSTSRPAAPRRDQPAPQPLAVARLREREVDHEVQPAQERVVDVAAEVRGEDDRARVGLHPLQQVRDLDVRVAVLGVRDLRALAEHRVGLVEEQDRVRPLARRRRSAPRFFSVSPMYLHTIVARSTWNMSRPRSLGQHLRGHRLAGPGLAREQDLQALGLRDAALVAPVGQHLVAMAQVGGDRAQRVELAIRDHQVLPRVGRLEPLGERARGATRTPRARPRRGRGRATSATCAASAICADREPELRADVGDVLDPGQLAPRRRRARRTPGGRTLWRRTARSAGTSSRPAPTRPRAARRGRPGSRRRPRAPPAPPPAPHPRTALPPGSARGRAPGPAAAGASGPKTTSGSVPRAAASSASRATSSARPGSMAGASTRRSAGAGSGASSRKPASRGATRIGRSTAGPSCSTTTHSAARDQRRPGCERAQRLGRHNAASIRGVTGSRA